LIEQAVASQYGKHAEFLDETLEFIRFTGEQIREFDDSLKVANNAENSP